MRALQAQCDSWLIKGERKHSENKKITHWKRKTGQTVICNVNHVLGKGWSSDREVIGTWNTDLQRRKATGFENNKSNTITRPQLNGAESSF
jgi:hypothetical protein